MKIMLDTNVLISMILFRGKGFLQMLEYITQNHTLVLSSFVVSLIAASCGFLFLKLPNADSSFNCFSWTLEAF